MRGLLQHCLCRYIYCQEPLRRRLEPKDTVHPEMLFPGCGFLFYHIPHRKNDNFQHLSEGQKQLVLLARTFAGKRKLLLLDEPESALDFRLRYQVMELLHEHVRKNQSSALVTLHDSSLALNYCDTLLVLSDSRHSGILEPAVTPVRKLELLLSEVYGPVSITVLSNRSGKRWLTMMKEDVIS